jgi:hypothetical protein
MRIQKEIRLPILNPVWSAALARLLLNPGQQNWELGNQFSFVNLMDQEEEKYGLN